jgi:subtilisin-like proprotein convertase family protein
LTRLCLSFVSGLVLSSGALLAAAGPPATAGSGSPTAGPAGELATVRLELDGPHHGWLTVSPGPLRSALPTERETTRVARGGGDLSLWIRYDARADSLDATVSGAAGEFSTGASSVVARGLGKIDPLAYAPGIQALWIQAADRTPAGGLELSGLEISAGGAQQRLQTLRVGSLAVQQLLHVDRRLGDGFELSGVLHLDSIQPTAARPLVLEVALVAGTRPEPARPENNYSVFVNTDGIAIPTPPATFGTSDPYPSTIQVDFMSGVVIGVQAAFQGLAHTYPDDIDALLVAPGGSNVMLMSDACGSGDLTGSSFTFDDAAPTQLADLGPCPDGDYRPTDYEPGDAMPSPAPPGPYGTSMSTFAGINPNGAWNLFVVDDAAGDTGSMTGWSLTIATQIVINDVSPASPYPSSYTISGVPPDSAMECAVDLFALTHTWPADIDMLFVAPNGGNVVIMSDVCGGNPGISAANFFLSDFNAAFMDPNGGCAAGGSFRPTNVGAGDPFPAPAPGGTNGRSLGDVSGSPVNGVWSLYVVDDAFGDTGTMGDWGFDCSTAPGGIFRDGFETGDTIRWSSETP